MKRSQPPEIPFDSPREPDLEHVCIYACAGRHVNRPGGGRRTAAPPA